MIWFVSRYRWRYNMYLNTYLNTVRCQRDIMSCMKAVTPVIRSTAHKLLLQWMEHLLLQLLLVEPKHEFPKFYQIMSINLIWKKYVFLFVIFKNACASSFMWFVIHWVCCILLSTLTSVASDLLNDALRLDNELSAWAATCSLRSVTEVTTKASGRHIPL